MGRKLILFVQAGSHEPVFVASPPAPNDGGEAPGGTNTGSKWYYFRYLVLLLLALLLKPGSCAATVPRPDEYSPLRFQVRVEDRLHRPLPQLRLWCQVELQGRARQETGPSQPLTAVLVRYSKTNEAGIATIQFDDRKEWPGAPPEWFRGQASLRVWPEDPAQEATPLGGTALHTTLLVPSPESAPPTLVLTCFEQPDLRVDGFPVWLGRDRRLDRVLVLLEGFDPYNNTSATDLMAILQAAGDGIRAGGVAMLVVNFPDAHLSPDNLAPYAARAVRAAAAASHHKVALAGVSAGGIVGRWALVEAEEKGDPLPVHTFLSLDAPNRGAHFNPGMEALILHYGRPVDRQAMTCPSAQVLIRKHPVNVKWKFLGIPPLGAEIPVGWDEEGAESSAFYDRLRHLNNHGGYPRLCRLVGVATGSRRGPMNSGDLVHLWVPFGYGWTLKAGPEDHEPGSLLPGGFREAFNIRFPLGLAGIYLRSSPTFIPTESALDADPDERPPFDEWFARPDGLPPLSHDRVDAGEVQFVVREALKSDWAESGAALPSTVGK